MNGIDQISLPAFAFFDIFQKLFPYTDRGLVKNIEVVFQRSLG
jgi:hypothetical protein